MSPTDTAGRALLGACLLDPEAIERVKNLVVVDDFPGERSREVWRAMLALHARGLPTDFVTVSVELERRGTLLQVGTANLTALVNACPTSLNAEAYAVVLAEAGHWSRPQQPERVPTLNEVLGL